MVQIMMKMPEENIIVRISLRWRGTWSFVRMGMGISRIRRSDLFWVVVRGGFIAFRVRVVHTGR